MDKLIRFAVLPRGGEPVLWDFGSAARHHQLYNPWLDGTKRARAGISTLRGAFHPDAGIAEEVARKVADRARASTAWPVSRSAWTWSRCRSSRRCGPRASTSSTGSRSSSRRGGSRPRTRSACSPRPARWSTPPTRSSTRFLRPGVRENECVGLVSKVLYDLGSEYVEGVNAISGERCSPHPHVYSDRIDPAGRPGVLRHPAQPPRLPHLLLPLLRGRQRVARDARRVHPLPRVHGPRDRAGAAPAPPPPTSSRCGRRAEEFGFADEEAAFALQYGHGVGLSIWEKPIFSRLVSLDHPETLEEGMVFALETYWPAGDGWSAARIEEEVVVTADGCEVITKFPAEELLVAGQRYWTVGGSLPTVRESQSHLNTAAGRGEHVTIDRGRSTAATAARPVRADGRHPRHREGRARPVPARPGQGHHPPGRRARGGGGRRECRAAPRRLRLRHLPRPPPRDRPRRHARRRAWPS